VAETVTIRNDRGEEREIPKTAVPFFVNQGYKVLTSDGRVNSKATSAAQKEN
jgi:hypothetical protein